MNLDDMSIRLWRRVSRRIWTERKCRFIVRGIQRMLPSKLDHLAPGVEQTLTKIAGDLDSISRQVESNFLAIADSLEKVPEISAQLVTRSEHLLRLAVGTEKDGDIFQITQQFIGQPLDFVERCHTETETLLEKVQETDQQFERLLSAEAILRRTVTPLRYIKMLFKVEAARFDNHVQQTFLALTEDIDRLHNQLSEAFIVKFESLRSTRGSVLQIARNLIQQTRAQKSVVSEKNERIKDVLNKLRETLRVNAQRDIKLTHVSQAIAKRVGEIVISLQAQDIVSQKVAHVTAAIREVQQGISRGSEQAAASPAEILQRLQQTCRLESAQLNAVALDLDQTHDRLVGDVEQIREFVTDLNQNCILLGEFDTITTGADGAVQVFLDALADLHCLVTTAVANVNQAHEAIRPIGGHASNLTGVMRELSAQIHLIALNAQVQAAHVGAGTGLEVLAASTAKIAMETKEVSEEIAGQLDDLTSGLDKLVGTCAELRTQATAQQELLDRERSTRENALHSFRDEALSELARVGTDSEQILALVEAMRSRVDLRSISHGVVQSARAALDQLQESTVITLDMLGHDGNAPVIADLHRRYTMASERAVHEASLAGGQVSESEAAASGTCEQSVQLFDDLGSTVPAASDAEATPQPVMMAGNEPALSPSNPPTAKKNDDFGQNVDLF